MERLDQGLVEWLLEENSPWVRYNTLVELLDKNKRDDEVERALEDAMKTPPISKILGQLEKGGFYDESASSRWGKSAMESGYFPKYRGFAWKALFLAQAGADPNDSRVEALGEYLLSHSFNPELNTFDVPLKLSEGYDVDFLMPCFIGNMVWTLCRLGFSDRAEVRKGFDWLVRYQRYDDGCWMTPTVFPYRGRRERCWGSHTCYWGITKLLRAMTIVPEGYWTCESKDAKRKAVDFVILHRLLWSSHDPSKPVAQKNTRPQRLTTPLTYYDDAIEITSTLLSLGVENDSIEDAVDYVLSKRNERGRWICENTPGPLDANFGFKGQESKWITFRAIKMLKLAGRIG